MTSSFSVYCASSVDVYIWSSHDVQIQNLATMSKKKSHYSTSLRRSSAAKTPNTENLFHLRFWRSRCHNIPNLFWFRFYQQSALLRDPKYYGAYKFKLSRAATSHTLRKCVRHKMPINLSCNVITLVLVQWWLTNFNWLSERPENGSRQKCRHVMCDRIWNFFVPATVTVCTLHFGPTWSLFFVFFCKSLQDNIKLF